MYSKQFIFNGIASETTIPQKVINEILMGGVEALQYAIAVCDEQNGWGRTLIFQSMTDMTLSRLDGSEGKLDKTAVPEIKQLLQQTFRNEQIKELWIKLKDQLKVYYDSSKRYKGQQWEDTPYGFLHHLMENIK